MYLRVELIWRHISKERVSSKGCSRRNMGQAGRGEVQALELLFHQAQQLLYLHLIHQPCKQANLVCNTMC